MKTTKLKKHIITVLAISLAGCGGGAAETERTDDSALLMVRPDGSVVVSSPWRPPYNIVDNHCHNAAAMNCSDAAGADGFISCTSIGSWTSGHTINWSPDPRPGAAPGSFCAYEPQANGGTVASGAICCWTGTSNPDGTPILGDPAAQPCVLQLCIGQAAFNWYSTTPVAWPPGVTPPVAQDCSTKPDRDSCASCCDEQAATQTSNFPQYAAQAAAYRLRCRQACGPTPLAADSDFVVTRPGSMDSAGIAQGRICADNASFWSTSSYLSQCLACCSAAGMGSPAGSGGTTSCEAVCNAAYK